MISAGRVLLMPKGDYDPTATYEMLDIVSYNGSSYIAKSTTTGNLPTNTTYWQLSAYGGQAANLAGNFAPLETTEYATRAYVADDIFVDKDSQLVIATTTINIGDEIEIGSNCDVTTMAELLDAIENRYDALDQRNRKLVGINPITIQTDLHLLAPGEYFKKLTNFYVTNAPTGINQVPTAIFRLTVESGLDESGSSLLLTLRATDGKVYTQSYDGTSWSAWVEVSSKAYVDNGLALKANIADLGTAAYKDSTNAVTSGSTDLVESGAVYSELALKADSEKAYQTDDTTETTLASDDIIPFYDTSATAKRKMTVQKFGEQLISNPNLLDNPWFTVNQRGVTSWSAAGAGYTADRWKHDASATGSITDGVYTCNVPTYQPWEDSRVTPLLGKVVTLSWMLSDGSIGSETRTLPDSLTSEFVWPFTNSYVVMALKSGNTSQMARINANVAVKAVKLEKGSISTLAMDTAPNYATELLKCQRYFLRVPNTGSAYASLGCGSTFSATQANIFIATPASMRAIPSVVLNGNFFMRGGGAVYSVSAANVYNYAANGVTLELTSSGMTANYAVELSTDNDATAYIDFSADL